MGVKIKRSNADGSVLVYRSINEEHCHEYTGDDPLRDKELRREIIGMFKQGSTPALVLHNLKV
jgi:hypothetical protein